MSKYLLTLLALLAGCEKTVDYDRIQIRQGLHYTINTETPFTGRAIKYHENGQKWTEVSFIVGKKHGLVTTWYENGQKSSQGIYSFGDREGIWVWWTESGDITEESCFRNDQLIARRVYELGPELECHF